MPPHQHAKESKMVLSYAQLSKKPRLFRKLTGLTLSDFAQVMQKSERGLRKIFGHQGRPRTLPHHEDKVLRVLIYLSHTPPMNF